MKIPYFNQQCVYTGYSEKRRNEIIDILKEKKISYTTKEKDALQFPSRKGTFGQLQQYQVIYKIYVHQKDFDEVSYLLRN
jgi:hypothetical protein